MIEMILIVFGGISFLIGVYALIKTLTTARKRLLSMVDGDILAFISFLAWILILIGGSAYWIFSSLDFEAARGFRRYTHSFTATYFVEGGICLLLTYGISKIKPNERLSEGKKLFIIAAGSILGLLSIFLGLKRIFGN